MFTLRRYAPAFKPEWNRFVERSKNGFFMFARDYMDYHADRFADHSLCIFRDEELFALIPACECEGEFVSHGGLTFGGVISDERMKTPYMLEIFDALESYLRQSGFHACVYKAVPHIYHRLPAEEDKYALFRHGAKLAKCEVTSTIVRPRPPAYSERRERGIKKAEKQGVTYHLSQDYDAYFAIVSLALERHGAKPTHSAAEMKLLAGRFPRNIALWTAQSKEGALLAGVIMYGGDRVAHAQYIALAEAGRNAGALDGLFHHLITRVYTEQAFLDFGISTEQGGQQLNTGLISQKEEFGARAVVHETFRWPL